MAEGEEVEFIRNEHDNVSTTGQQKDGGIREDRKESSSLLLQLGESLTQIAARAEPGSRGDSLGRGGARPHDGASYDWSLPGTGAELDFLLAQAFAAGAAAQSAEQGIQATSGDSPPPGHPQGAPLETEYRVEESTGEDGEGTPRPGEGGSETPGEGDASVSEAVLEAIKHGAQQATEVTEPGQKCVILQGIPASGKSTWARALVLADPAWKRVNRDELRLMLHGGVWTKANEKLTKHAQMAIILNALDQGYNVVVDDTNLSPKVVRQLRSEIGQAFPSIGWKIIRFNVPLAEALRRNRLRPLHERVPDHVIRRMMMEFDNYRMEL